MNTIRVSALISVLFLAVTAQAQVPRDNVFWARTSAGPIVLDGVLDEVDWAKAETKFIQYEQSAGIPGSGWKLESGAFFPTDPATATVRMLVVGNQLYLGVDVTDESVGGSEEFNRFDGLLMALKDHVADTGGTASPPAEYFYTWWYPQNLDPQPAGQVPQFLGKWAQLPYGTPRTQEDIDNWDAVTVVHGTSNDDSDVDAGYTVEMRFNLTPMGYDVTQPGGDILEWNISIYDCDWFWPFNASIFGTQRVWWQSPWGNTAWYDEVRVFARPDVTVDTPVVPFLPPEVVIPRLTPAPTIDGELTESIWSDASIYEFDLRWNDTALRDSYPEVGPFRSGQFQPEIEGGAAFVVDGADATVKMFFEGSTLYMGFDVRDLVITSHTPIDRWDGFSVSLNDRVVVGADNNLQGRDISFRVDTDGSALAEEYLTTLLSSGDAQVAISMNPGSVPDNVGNVDNGYTAELAVDLTALGYPANLGDRALFIGVVHFDADSFIPVTDSYATRVWWFRERAGDCCPAWAHLEPTAVGVLPDFPGDPSAAFAYAVPNPSRGPALRYSFPRRARLEFSLYDLRGRLVERRDLGVQGSGERQMQIDWRDHSAGIYLYQLRGIHPTSGEDLGVVHGKTVLVK